MVTIRAYLQVSLEYILISRILTNLPNQNDKPFKEIVVHVDLSLRLRLSQHKVALGSIGLDLGASGIQMYFKERWIPVRAETSIPIQHGGMLCLRSTGVVSLEGWTIDRHFL